MQEKTFSDFHIEITPGQSGEIDTQCPECGPSRKKRNAKCLSVNVEKGVWTCHHCQWAGGLASGVWAKSVPALESKKVYEKPSYPVEQPLNDEAAEFFKKRGISRSVVERNRIVSGHVWMPELEQKTFVVQFPYFRDGELINCKYRALEKKAFTMAKGCERILYGLDDLGERQDGDMVIFVEGEIDKLSCEEAGFLKVLSVPDGAPSTGSVNLSGKMSYLDTAAERLAPFKKFVIAVDADGPGQTLQAELIRRLGPDCCFIVQWPEGCKDANEVLLQQGKEALQQAIRTARPCPLSGVLLAEDFREDFYELIEHGLQPGASTGWPLVDVFYTIKPGQLDIVTGMPGDGKSLFVDAITVNLAENEGWKFAIFSPEFYPVSRHLISYAQQYLGKTFLGTHAVNKEDAEHALNFLNEHFYFIGQDDIQLQNVDTLIQQAESLVRRFGVHGLVIDPWNEIDHTRDIGLTETEYISKCLTKFRIFARKFRVHVWIIAHPTKQQKLPDGSYPMPDLYSISGSAHWRNKADNGIVVFRNREEAHLNITVISIQKIKFKEVGKIGEFNLEFDALTGRYRTPYAAMEF